MNLWLRYAIYLVVILVIAFVGQLFIDDTGNRAILDAFNNNVFLFNIFRIVLFGSIGVLLGIEQFLKEMKKEGIWKLNLPRIMLMVIPSLYFSLAYIIFYNFYIPRILIYPIEFLFKNGSPFVIVFQIIFGFSIITSFNKKTT